MTIPFANAASSSYKRSVPVLSQIGITDGAASLTDGFPPLTATPRSSGGVPPDIKDMNGILNQITAWDRWHAVGGQVLWDAPYSIAIGGYPAGACVRSSTPGNARLFWYNTVENNTTNPDAGGANWEKQGMPTIGADYLKYPDGLVDQWGVYDTHTTTEAVVPITFQVPLTTTSYHVQLTAQIASAGLVFDCWVQVIRGSKSTTGFSVQIQSSGSSQNLDGFEWRVVGR
jgi:hypothetical protein